MDEITPQDENIDVPPSNDAPIPPWLKVSYVILPIWGIICFILYWNGSTGWLDRGYWRQLQEAANTTFPEIEQKVPGIELHEGGVKKKGRSTGNH